jgi:hypothetical protein
MGEAKSMVSAEDIRRALSPPPIVTTSEPVAFTLTLNLAAILNQTCRNCGHKMPLPNVDEIEKLSGFAYQKKESYAKKKEKEETTTLITATNDGELEL